METENQEAKRKQSIVRVTLLGSVGNFLLLLFKFVAGWLGHSSAMMADAVHSLSDFITDVVVLFFVNLSAKPKDQDHDYGHGKYETLATTLVGLVLLFVGFGLFWEGIQKVYQHFFLHQPLESPGWIALVAALVSIVVKELLYQVTAWVGRKENSQVVVANAWHHRSDAFSSIGTAIGIGGAILLGEQWRVLDPLAAIIVSVLIVKVAFQLVIPAINDLLEKSLPKDQEDEILAIVRQTAGMVCPHNLRTRHIGNNIAIEMHIRVDGNMTVNQAHDLTKDIELHLRQRYGYATHIALHVEPTK